MIMVLSCMKPPFDKLYYTQKNTWDSIKHNNIETVYYFGDEFEEMHIPFKRCLENIWDKDWDVIFRTNSSSYINKDMMYDYIKNFNTNNLWIGDETGYNSGAGFFISRDLAKVLIEKLPEDKYPYEDVIISDTIIKHKGIPSQIGLRCCYNHDNKSFFPCYHIRYKNEKTTQTWTWGTTTDRQEDVDALNHIFNYFNKNK